MTANGHRDRVEPTAGPAMSAVLPITPRGPSYNVPRATIIDSGRCSEIDTRTKEEHFPRRLVNPGTGHA